MIKNIIALYPGRFQPFGKHHAEAFKWLEKQFGAHNCYIVTSNVIDPVKSPFSFKDKHDIISNYGLADRLVQVKNPYKAEEITTQLNPEDTALVFMVGAKDMKEDPRFKIGKKKDGSDSYFQEYAKNKSNLQGFDKHGYLIVAPHISMNIPGYGEMSGTTLRNALGDNSVTRDQRIKLFKAAFGWYNEKTAKMIFDRLEGLTESKSSFIANIMKQKNLTGSVSENQTSFFTKEWWSESLNLPEIDLVNYDITSEGYMSFEQQKQHDKKMIKLKKFLKNNTGKPFVYDFNEFPKTVYGVKMPTQEDINELLINEGGAGGHMQHLFNIEGVQTGKDLVKVFVQSVEYLKKSPASVKIDGVNASIRLITLDGKKVFVMDRGSNKPLDVKGITKAELEDRFGAGHGMIKVGGTVLDIFNESLSSITPALKKLGLWDNPNIMFNLEYVAGSTNVLSYNKNFLAVHGLLEIEQVTPKRRATKEIKYSKPALQDLLNNLVPAAAEKGYEVLGSIPTTLDGDPDLTGALNKKYTVNYGNKKETKTLSQWLAQTTIPDNEIKTVDGKRISALSKDVLIKISEGTPLSEYIADPKDYKAAVDGFVTYMATMKLGDAILEKLNSPLGPVSDHEGIVIRDPKISKKPFKITGNFILGGLASSFKK